MPDVEFGRFEVLTARSQSDPVGGPKPEEIRRVVNAGGTIVYQFNMPKVRAILPLANIHTLGRQLTAVTDPRAVEDILYVQFRSQIDASAITALGGEILSRDATYHAVVARVPDPFVWYLRRDPRVEMVDGAEGWSCLA